MGAKWDIARAMEEKPPGFHPLAGCDWKNWFAHRRSNQEYSKRTRPQRITSFIALLMRQPFTLIERFAFARKVAEHRLPKPPVFIIGHWRSGTTHLHNLFSIAPGFATIDFGQTAMPHNLLNPTRVLGRAAVARVIPKDRGMDGVKLGIEEPQEEEMAIGNLNPICYYNVFYYPHQMRHHFERSIFLENTTPEERETFKAVYVKLLKKLSIAGGERPLLLKNPASTARVELLDRLFEGARFIHIVRNPYEVFASMLHHYPRLFNAFSWHDFDDIDLEEMVFYKYRRIMQGYLEQRASVGDRLVETSYEALIADSIGEISRIEKALGMGLEPAAYEGIRAYLEGKKDYRRNRYQLTQAQVSRIQDEWGFALKEWGYGLPESIEVVS